MTLAAMLMHAYEKRAITTDLLRKSDEGISETSAYDTGLVVTPEMNTLTSRMPPIVHAKPEEGEAA